MDHQTYMIFLTMLQKICGYLSIVPVLMAQRTPKIILKLFKKIKKGVWHETWWKRDIKKRMHWAGLC